MSVIVDLQGFRGLTDSFIVKEVAIISMDGYKVGHFLFKSPLSPAPKPRDRFFLENHFHGLLWDTGYINFEDFEPLLTDVLKKFETVYVKGLEKRKVLLFLDKNIINLDEIDCPSLDSLRRKTIGVQCLHHNIKKPVCALENVLILSDWLRENEHTGNTESIDVNPEPLECASRCICI